MRPKRKLEHLAISTKLPDGPGSAGFGDVKLVHCALPELGLEEIDISGYFFNKKLQAPIIINAITGGALESIEVNRSLAKVAKSCGLAMAVGSQTAGLENKQYLSSFKIVRETNPTGLIFANLGAHVSPLQAKEAVKMIEADALQIHLNVPQELSMLEGDRNFKGYLNNIKLIQDKIEVPTIVKEVGFGISYEVARKLHAAGIHNVDVGGLGGTNFIAIETERNKQSLGAIDCEIPLDSWGISTVTSLIEVSSKLKWDNVIATGGVRNALDCTIALALGADLVGIAGPFLRILVKTSEKELSAQIEDLKEQLKRVLLLTGAGSLSDAKKIPAVISGATKHWLEQRGFDTSKYAKRL